MSQYVEVTCRRYMSEFCCEKCFYRGFGCAGEHVLPRKKKKEAEP